MTDTDDRRWTDVAAENKRLAAQLATARAVTQRLRDGWMPVEEGVGDESFDRWYLESGIGDGPETNADANVPMTEAERAWLAGSTDLTCTHE